MLMLAGVRDILVISTPEALPVFKTLLGDGSQWGLTFTYKEQKEPRGLADAFIIGKEFIGDDSVCLILGDNIFFGTSLPERLRAAAEIERGAIVFAYQVRDPERYGVVEFDEEGLALSIEEKPEFPRSHFAIPGIYFYDNRVVDFADNLKPSPRGELEITDLNQIYLELGELYVDVLGRGVAWLDAGTHESLLQAANFVQAVEDRQGMMISCPEEIAFRMGYIEIEQYLEQAEQFKSNQYGEYLIMLYQTEFSAKSPGRI
jgi:glucose-1-phosphate thymidylyltransferase